MNEAMAMQALTLWQPWAWAMAHAGKAIENRTWKPPRTACGHLIAIHAGKTCDDRAIVDIAEEFGIAPIDWNPSPTTMLDMRVNAANPRRVGHMVRGAIVAVGWLAGWVSAQGDGPKAHLVLPQGYPLPQPEIISRALLGGWYQGPYGWVVLNRVALPEPILCRGAQGLWRLPPDISSRVANQVADHFPPETFSGAGPEVTV